MCGASDFNCISTRNNSSCAYINKHLLSVDRPWAEPHVTVTVEPDRAYVEDIPESLSTIRSAILSPAKKATSVGSDLSFTLINLQRVSLKAVELWYTTLPEVVADPDAVKVKVFCVLLTIVKVSSVALPVDISR